jgi:CDP-diacylglycerol--glycerol-3-phosphate 3-phosphatidyltransferase
MLVGFFFMMTIPNILTLSRIALIPLFVVLYYLQPAYTETPIFTWINFSVTGVYAAISMTDYLDGYLARKLKMTSKLGAFLDPVADKLMVSSLVLHALKQKNTKHKLLRYFSSVVCRILSDKKCLDFKIGGFFRSCCG